MTDERDVVAEARLAIALLDAWLEADENEPMPQPFTWTDLRALLTRCEQAETDRDAALLRAGMIAAARDRLTAAHEQDIEAAVRAAAAFGWSRPGPPMHIIQDEAVARFKASRKGGSDGKA